MNKFYGNVRWRNAKTVPLLRIFIPKAVKTKNYEIGFISSIMTFKSVVGFSFSKL